MKNLVITALVLAAIAGTTCFVSFRATGDAEVRSALEKRDALAWLRSEFSLTEPQFQKVKAYHDAYSVECEEHCRAIQEAIKARRALEAGPTPDSAKVAAAEKRVQELRLVCETAIARHVRRCAAEMSPAAGERYLTLVLPKIADFDHKAPPDLRLDRHSH